MKKIVFIFTLMSFVTFAQDNGYNKFSIDLNGGFSKPSHPFTPGTHSKTFGFFHGDIGVRYMFNTKFGIKADFGYDDFKVQNRPNLESTFTRINLQGVINLGRVLNFETFAPWFNAQLHSGFGWAGLSNNLVSGTDNMSSFIAGLTGQVKLTDWLAFNADFSYIGLNRMDRTFDGADNIGGVPVKSLSRAFQGDLWNASVGFSVYLGKNKNHADWTFDENSSDVLEGLEKRVADLEMMLQDTDKDGVPDYLDLENNSIAGVMVDHRGRMIDTNKNGIPDEIEKYVEGKMAKFSSNIGGDSTSSGSGSEQEVVKKLINDGYVTAYFDFNKSTPTANSLDGINFIRTFLMNNPSEKVSIIGYADEIGSESYNNQLASRRANNVKELLIKSGISGSRISTSSAGEDTSVDKSSAKARSMIRRVLFKTN